MTARTTLYAGIDIGSLSTDVVLLDGNLAVVGTAILATGASMRRAAREAFDAALSAGGASMEEVVFTVATGYGRESAEGADLRVTEITCHARGARRLFPGALTVLDIGGQVERGISDRMALFGGAGVSHWSGPDNLAPFTGAGALLLGVNGGLAVRPGEGLWRIDFGANLTRFGADDSRGVATGFVWRFSMGLRRGR